MSYGTPTLADAPTYTASVGLGSGRQFNVSFYAPLQERTEQQCDDDFQAFVDYLAAYPAATTFGAQKTYPNYELITETP
jgi:hypothetical protein